MVVEGFTTGHAILILAFLTGLAGVPVFLAFFGKSLPLALKGIFGRILWTIGALAFGPYVLERRQSGMYELLPVEKRDVPLEDRQAWGKIRDGEFIEIQNGLDNWFLLGKQKFGITYEKTHAALSDVEADPWRSRGRDVEADGGDIAVLEGVERGGRYGEFTGYPNGSPVGEILLDSTKVDRVLRTGGDAKLGAKAKEVVLRDEGGGANLSMAAWAAALIMALILGVGTGLAVVFVG